MKEKTIRFRLFSILIVFSLIPLILSIAIISVTSLCITKNNLEKSAKDTLFIVANNLANHCNENEITAMNAGDYYYYLDSLKENNIEMAIILNDGTCVTSIKNENDYRIREIDCMEEAATGYFDNHVVINDKIYCAYYMPIIVNGETSGMAFAGELQSNVTGATKSIVIIFVAVAGLLIVLFAVIMLILNKRLLESFEAVDKNVYALSKGSLGKQKEYVSLVKEMDTLLQATGLLQENLSETIGKAKNVSKRLVENIAEAVGLSKSSSDRAKQITTAMEALSASALEMSNNVQDINVQMSEIENCVNDISESVEHLNNSSENILQTNDEAKQHMNTIMESSRRSVGAVRDIASQIRETNTSITEIDRAVELILAISQQTRLLSLNASIEAARAGVHGRGFAVVAEEIGSLSQQSAEGAEMIKNLAKVITEKSKKSVELADGVQKLILTEQENVSQTQDKYAKLSQDINQSVDEIRSISDKTLYLTDYKERVIKNVQELAAISKENTANNEEVDVNITKIISEVQTVSNNCEIMSDIAKELEESVAYFHD